MCVHGWVSRVYVHGWVACVCVGRCVHGLVGVHGWLGVCMGGVACVCDHGWLACVHGWVSHVNGWGSMGG